MPSACSHFYLYEIIRKDVLMFTNFFVNVCEMKRKDDKRPTDMESIILAVLWERGESTVREVHEELSKSQAVGLTTVLKIMQIMLEKGLVKRDETVRPQRYEAASAREQTQQLMLKDLADRVFDGGIGNLVLQALSMRKSSPEELREVRALLDEMKEG